MMFYVKVFGTAALIAACVVGFVCYIAYEVENSTKCTCEMVKNHECP